MLTIYINKNLKQCIAHFSPIMTDHFFYQT